MNLISLVFAVLAATQLNPGEVKTPSSGNTEAIGSYGSGCLAGGQALPLNSETYQVTHKYRNRYYGDPALIAYIENLAAQIHAETGNMILIGDLAQPRGGLMVNGHSSHQTGLDVDIWFMMTQSPLAEDYLNSFLAPNMVTETGIDQALWSPRFLQLASEAPEVERIFVSPPIKKELCNLYKGEAWLRKIRPWWEHKDHFHARLHCPKSAKHCVKQPALPQCDGCDKSLDWWFTEEATKPAVIKTARASTAIFQKAPEQCTAVFAEPEGR